MGATKRLFDRYQEVLIPAGLLWLLGILTAANLTLPSLFWWSWSVGVFLLLLGCLVFLQRNEGLRWYLWLLSFLWGGSFWMLAHFHPGPLDASHWASRSPVQVDGTVLAVGASDSDWIMAVHHVGDHRVTGRILVKVQDNLEKIYPGERLTIKGQLALPHGSRFTGDFDYRDYLFQQKITALLYGKSVNPMGSDDPSIWLKGLRIANDLRHSISQTFQAHLPDPEGAILASIVLGDHAVGLDTTIKQSFIRSGLIHVLAASGMNVGLIALFILFLGQFLRLSDGLKYGIAMLGVGIYALLTGLPPSILRAGVMLELAFFLKLLNRDLSPVSLLAITGVLLSLVNPMVVSMLGFQLSFLSTLGLLSMTEPLQKWCGFYLTHWIAGILLVPLVAQLWVTPVLLYSFHQVPMASLPANLLALPIVAFLTYSGFALGALSLVIPHLIGPCIACLYMPCWALHRIAELLGDFPGALWQVPMPPLPLALLLMGWIALATYILNFPQSFKPKTSIILLMSLGCFILTPLSWAKWRAAQEIHIFWIPTRIHQGLTWIQLPEGGSVMDTDDLSRGTTNAISSLLRRDGKQAISLLMVASPHIRHVDGFERLAQQHAVSQLALPEGLDSTIQTQLLSVAQSAQIPVHFLSQTQLVSGSAIQTTFYSMGSEAFLQRFQWHHGCFAVYAGEADYERSPFQALSQDCTMILAHANGSLPSRLYATAPGQYQTQFLENSTLIRIATLNQPFFRMDENRF